MSYEDWSQVRSIPPKTRGNRGFFPSQKVVGGVVEYESQLERDLYLILEHDSFVSKFQHQPHEISYRNQERKNSTYTPDTKIRFSNGVEVLIEVKYAESVIDEFEENQAKWVEATKWSKKRGMLFVILTDQEIRTPRMANIWFTLGSSKCIDNDKYIKGLVEILSTHGRDGCRYNELCYELADTIGVELSKAAQIVCYAIYHDLVFVDSFTTQIISKNTVIRKRIHSEDNKLRSFYQIIKSKVGIIDEQLLIFQEKQEEKRKDNSDIFTPLKGIKTLFTEKDYKIVVERLRIVNNWLKTPVKKRKMDWRLEFCHKTENHYFGKKITDRTVRRWVKNYETNGIEGLIPKSSISETRGRKTSIDPRIMVLMEEARLYSLRPQKTIDEAYNKLKDDYKALISILTKKCEPIEGLIIPTKNMFMNYKYRKTTTSEKVLYRKGKRYYKSHMEASLASFMQAILPMQVLQFDNTPCDVFLVDSKEAEPVGTANLTAGIDCYTRMITGFYISLDSSSKLSALETLLQSILDKTPYCDNYESRLDWSIQGFPVLILVDNGMDYRASDLKKFCMAYNIILEYAPIRNPKYKGLIERWFLTLKHGLIAEKIPAVRPKLIERLNNPDLKPEYDAILTLQTLEKWLHKWVIDEYHTRNPYQDHVLSPFQRWEEARSGITPLVLPKPREPPNEEFIRKQMYIDVLDEEKRVLDKDGIEIDWLQFNNKELQSLLSEKGKIASSKRITLDVKVKIDRRDIRIVWVDHPDARKSIEVKVSRAWSGVFKKFHGNLPISRSVWAMERKQMRKQNISKMTPYIYEIEKSRYERQMIIQEGRRKSKKKRRMKEAARQNKRKKTSSRVLSTEKQPLKSQDDPLNELEQLEAKGRLTLKPRKPYPKFKR